jgi:hypothetical protein
LAALQLLNDEPEAFDLGLRLSEVGAFARERPDHPLQRLHIVWCRSLGDLKKYSTATKACVRDQAQPRGPHSRSVACTEVTIVASHERSVRP